MRKVLCGVRERKAGVPTSFYQKLARLRSGSADSESLYLEQQQQPQQQQQQSQQQQQQQQQQQEVHSSPPPEVERVPNSPPLRTSTDSFFSHSPPTRPGAQHRQAVPPGARKKARQASTPYLHADGQPYLEHPRYRPPAPLQQPPPPTGWHTAAGRGDCPHTADPAQHSPPPSQRSRSTSSLPQTGSHPHAAPDLGDAQHRPSAGPTAPPPPQQQQQQPQPGTAQAGVDHPDGVSPAPSRHTAPALELQQASTPSVIEIDCDTGDDDAVEIASREDTCDAAAEERPDGAAELPHLPQSPTLPRSSRSGSGDPQPVEAGSGAAPAQHYPPAPPALWGIYDRPAPTEPPQAILFLRWSCVRMGHLRPGRRIGRPVPVLLSTSLRDAAGMFVAHVNEVKALMYGDLVATRTLAGIRSTAGKAIRRADWGRSLASVKAVVQPGGPGLRLELVLRRWVVTCPTPPDAGEPALQADPIPGLGALPEPEPEPEPELTWGEGEPIVATDEERAFYREVMTCKGRDPAQVMVTHARSGLRLRRLQLQCLKFGVWLNDEVINTHMHLLQERDALLRGPAAEAAQRPRPPAPRCHLFSSFFCNKLCKDAQAYRYANVRRWTTPHRLLRGGQLSDCILDLDRVIMPVHCGAHWTCAVIDIKAKALYYYDSLLGEDEDLLLNLARWLEDEALDKRKQTWDVTSWPRHHPKDIPVQVNGCDCGVFTIMFADYLALGRPMHWTRADMDTFRVKMLSQLKASCIQ
ncbi:MAG: hypothetical protein WDW36_000064 [Sanguina aurantia]